MHYRQLVRRGLTLIELLMVIAIVTVLLAILLPVLSKTHAMGNELTCQNNLRQLMTGMISFAGDHNEHLPGTYFDVGDPIPWHRDWLSLDSNFLTAPQGGLISPPTIVQNSL